MSDLAQFFLGVLHSPLSKILGTLFKFRPFFERFLTKKLKIAKISFLKIDKVYNAKKIFGLLLSTKNRPKNHFWLWGPGKPGRRYIFKKFNLFRQFYVQISIFSIKVCFLPNADILDYGNDTFRDLKILRVRSCRVATK
jgi:hypothetical protein